MLVTVGLDSSVPNVEILFLKSVIDDHQNLRYTFVEIDRHRSYFLSLKDAVASFAEDELVKECLYFLFLLFEVFLE